MQDSDSGHISGRQVTSPLYHPCFLFFPSLWLSSVFINFNTSIARLLPKKIFREPFGLPKLEIGSPRYISRSPRLFSQIQTMSYETYSLDRKGVVPPGGGDSNIKKVGMLVENFEIDPYGRPIWAWLAQLIWAWLQRSLTP